MTADELKRAAATAALAELPDAGVIGLGTGSTAGHFIELLARADGSASRYVGVPTSELTRDQARDLGLPLLEDDGPWDIAVCVDGADEVDPRLDMIKGGGGAHTREKIVNHCARKNVIIVEASKVSSQLGQLAAVPVEVLAFAHGTTRRRLASLGTPALRMRGDAPWRTDAGNLIYDLTCGPIDGPAALEHAIRAIPGVVESGLFVGRADVVLIARESGVERRVRG